MFEQLRQELYQSITVWILGPGKERASQFGQKDKKPTTPSTISPGARLEHSLVLQSLQECIGPRLSPEVSEIKLIFSTDTTKTLTL